MLADTSGLWVEASRGRAVARYHAGRVDVYRSGGGRAIDIDAIDWSTAGRAEWAMLWWRSRDAARALRAAGLEASALRAVSVSSDGSQWFAARTAVDSPETLVRLRDRRFERVPLRAPQRFTVIRHVVEDREGSIWIATDRGLFQLVPRKVFPLTRADGLADDFTAPVLQTRDGAVWVGTWGGGLHRFADGRLAARYGQRTGFLSDEIRSLYESADSTLWVGGVYFFASLRNGRVTSVQRVRQETRAFAETSDGRFWVGAANALLSRTPHGFVPDRPDVWATKSIWALHATRDGALWIGAQGGLFRLRNDSLRAFGPSDGVRSAFITSIHETSDGALWFGTYEDGLIRYRNGRFTTLSTRDGLPANGIWSMLDDAAGGLWMSSDRGIFRVEAARMNGVADAIERGAAAPTHLDPLVFTENEGMPTRECNRASPGGWRLDDGRLAFNNAGGLVIIDPARATAQQAPAPTRLLDVLADGDSMRPSPTQGASFTAGVKQIAFDFAALTYAEPSRVLYRYRLDPYDADWVSAGTRMRASYTALPPGKYTFRVQGRNAGAPAWGAEAAIAVGQEPSIWQTAWLRLVALLAVAGALVLAHRYRVARLLELERLRLRIASDLHDDVGSSLSSIALLSGMLARHTSMDGIEQRQLQRIQQAAHETIGALRDIIWLVQPNHDNLDDLVRKMRQTASSMLAGAESTIEIEDPVDATPLRIAFMRNVLLIYKEALHNAVRHAGASRIDVSVRVNHRMLTLRIRDDGVGFVPTPGDAGHGLANMRRRATEIGAGLDIASTPGAGCEVALTADIA